MSTSPGNISSNRNRDAQRPGIMSIMAVALGALMPMTMASPSNAADAAPPAGDAASTHHAPTAVASSFQAGNEPAKAVDGDASSIWHSQWDPKVALPQSITLDQGAADTVACVTYLPRQGGGNGTMTAYAISVSVDGTTFTTVVDNGRWPANGKRKFANFPPVSARFVRLEALAGVGDFASAAEIALSRTPIDAMAEPNMVSVLSPAYGADITGDTTIGIVAPGLATAVVSCWKQGAAPGKGDAKGTIDVGADSIIGTITLDTQGKGSIVFPANAYPHGPICVFITASGAGTGGAHDTCCLQLYNLGGVSWNEGLPKDPPAASGMTLIFADDFTTKPSISSKDPKATYYDHKPPDGSQDFSSLRFTGFDEKGNPFAQKDTYLRIRADEAKNSSGLISSMKNDASGVTATNPCYFECRLIGANAIGAWPAFWLLSDYMTEHVKSNKDVPCDELDIIEAYGGEGKASPNAFDKYCVTPHAWNQGKPGQEAEQAALRQFNGPVVSMKKIGIASNWYQAFHVYGCKITDTDTIYYCDDIEICRHKTLDISRKAPFFFLINLATGGGWPVDLSRYNGLADMYIDYVRVYSANPGDIERAKKK